MADARLEIDFGPVMQASIGGHGLADADFIRLESLVVSSLAGLRARRPSLIADASVAKTAAADMRQDADSLIVTGPAWRGVLALCSAPATRGMPVRAIPGFTGPPPPRIRHIETVSAFPVLGLAQLTAAACAGVDVDSLVEGAAQVMQRAFGPGSERTPPAMPGTVLGAVVYAMATSRQRPVVLIVPESGVLQPVGRWLAHLWAEQLSRRKADGFTGLVPLRIEDPENYRSFLLESPQDRLVLFLRTAGEADHTRPLRRALMAGGRPNLTITIPLLTASHLGELLGTLELATLIIGEMFGVDPFSEPSTIVESGAEPVGATVGRQQPGLIVR